MADANRTGGTSDATRKPAQRPGAIEKSPIQPDIVEVNRLSPGAMQQLHYALLSELAELLENAKEQVEQLRDGGLQQWPLVMDTRGPFQWIADTVEALDALGWQDAILRLEGEADVAAGFEPEPKGA